MASDPTVAEFRAAFAEFSTTADDAVTAVIETSAYIYAFNDEARLFLVAHVITVGAENTGALDGGSGVVTRERIGQREVYYNGASGETPMTPDEAWFQRSSYGRMYRTMVKRSSRYVLGMFSA